jgi:hypothetical protein
MADLSSRPLSSPRRTTTRTERRIIKVRLARRWGPARIAYPLSLVLSTVHRVLARLSHVDRAADPPLRTRHTGRVRARQHQELGNIPDGGGHRVHGQPSQSAQQLRTP